MQPVTGAATTVPLFSLSDAASEKSGLDEVSQTSADTEDRIVDIHVHFDEKNPNFIRDLVTLAQRIKLTAYLLTRVRAADQDRPRPLAFGEELSKPSWAI